ncbi:serine/threonine protein phosphatase [Candidatus Bathyarchaeota archaeon]|nr:serine/threonine protein phosphatase [Candidatus Bathyarchaeota archaeon]
MQIDFPKIVKEALESQHDSFVRIVDNATRLICGENGKIGSLNVAGRLARLKPEGEGLVIGDLHGDLESLIDIIQESNFLRKMSQNGNAILIFLGDYGDRGEYSKEVYYTVLRLKLMFPEQVVLMRGNHEGPEDLLASPHDLPSEFQMKFGEKWQMAYSKVRSLFDCLYNAVLVEERYLMIHGGLPHQAKTLEDLAYAHSLHPQQSFLEEMLWSDPDEIVEETSVSPRGAGRLFGEKITSEVLERFNVRIMIRGHEPSEEGFKTNHNGKILTLFSRKGAPYFNEHGAYLDLDLSKKFEDAEQLIPYICKF